MSAADPDERGTLDRLLQQCARGDHGVFAELYRRTSPRLFGLCLRMLRDRGAAEDVLQEVFVTVWRNAASYDATRAGAMTWLITLARNRAIDRLRKRRETALDPQTALQYAAADGASETYESSADTRSPASAAEGSQEYGRLQRCLEELDPEPQSSIREAFFSGATYNELATRRNVPLGTMKSWIRRGLLQLRKCLEQ